MSRGKNENVNELFSEKIGSDGETGETYEVRLITGAAALRNCLDAL